MALNILMVAQLFERPNDNGSDRNYYFCKHWLEAGHNVTVLTGNVDYKNAKKRFQKSGVHKENIDGINIIYVPVFTSFRGSTIKRFIFFISFVCSVLYYLLNNARSTDIIYGISTPLTVPFICSVVARLFKKDFICEITDVWPDAAIHTGVVRNKMLIKMALIMERFCYRSATKIICLTNGIAEILLSQKGVEKKKLAVVTNGVDTSLFKKIPISQKNIWRKKLRIKKGFCAMYLGAHGKYNSLHTIVEAALLTKENNKVTYLLVGDGDEKKKLQQYVLDHGLKNVKFWSSVPRNDAVEILQLADCFILPNLKGKFFECNLPNKFFDYMATGAPIIVCGDVEAGKIVKAHSIGATIAAENPVQLSSEILEMYGKQGRSINMHSGRDLAFQQYNRSFGAQKILDLFLELQR